MLSGVLPFTGGDALVYGEPISSEGGMDRIRSLMGVCPQFDVLWGELTGTEHLLIYGHVKGLPYLQVKAGAGGGGRWQVFFLFPVVFFWERGFVGGR
jgi:ABC-type multidrug transport system ATPase subunit